MDKQRRNEYKRATFLNRHVSPLQNHGGKIPRGPKHLHCGQVCFLIQDGQYCSMEPELWRRTGDGQGMKDMGKNRQGTDLVALATAGPAPPRGLRPSGLWLDRGQQETSHSCHLVFSGQTAPAASWLRLTGGTCYRNCLSQAEDKEGLWWRLPGAQSSEDPPGLSQKEIKHHLPKGWKVFLSFRKKRKSKVSEKNTLPN